MSSKKALYLKWLADRTGRAEVLPAPELSKEASSPDQKGGSSPQDYEYDADEEPYVPIGVNGLLAATERLLAVNKGLADTDVRDSAYFKKHFEADRQIWERIRTDTGSPRKKLLRMVSSRRNLSAMTPFYFDDYTEKHIVGNPLVSPLEEINPMHLVENARRITGMGPGGIPSEESITPEMNSVSGTQFGFIDQIAGPECFAMLSDAQVFTLRGWVSWPEVTDDDYFACWVNERLEYHPSERVIRSHYDGDILVATGRGLFMAVTPNHRVVFRSGPRGDLKTEAAEQVVSRKSILIPTEGSGHVKLSGDKAWSITPYNGMVYCATVPGGRLLCRGQEDHVGYWTGNSSRAGVDVRMNWGAKMGSNGRVYQLFRNRRTGKLEWKSPSDLDGKNVKLPD